MAKTVLKLFQIFFLVVGIPSLALANGTDSFAPLVKKLSNSVVNISSSLKVKEGNNTKALGSGFILDAEKGIIITNNHVIQQSDKIEIYFHDGSKLPVTKIIGADSKSDIAVLQVEPNPRKPLTAAKLGNSDTVEVGDRVLAIGNPFGLGGSVSVGIISAKGRDINSGPYDDYLQTDAAINKGNSGGPLFDMDGNVIGMNTAIISPTGGSIGIGFSIPSNTISLIATQLEKNGRIIRGYIGVSIQEMTDDLYEAIGLPENEGALITGVIEGSPAEKAKIKIGDVIVKVNDEVVQGNNTLPKIIANEPVGKDVDLTILRHGVYIVIKTNIASLLDDPAGETTEPEDNDGEGDDAPAQEQRWGTVVNGLKLVTSTAELRGKYKHVGKANGVLIINFVINSPADKIGLRIGDIITSVNQETVERPDEVVKILAKLKEANKSLALLQVQDKTGKTHFYALPLF